MSRIMYREMKDSDKEKESGKMVRPTSVPLFYVCFNKRKKTIIAVFEMLH